jgi:hypothetical protein
MDRNNLVGFPSTKIGDYLILGPPVESLKPSNHRGQYDNFFHAIGVALGEALKAGETVYLNCDDYARWYSFAADRGGEDEAILEVHPDATVLPCTTGKHPELVCGLCGIGPVVIGETPDGPQYFCGNHGCGAWLSNKPLFPPAVLTYIRAQAAGHVTAVHAEQGENCAHLLERLMIDAVAFAENERLRGLPGVSASAEKRG